jgi:hypothetical protein
MWQLPFQLATACLHLSVHVLPGKLKDNEVKRAIQLRDIVTSLGPAYIKLGQALSIRPDILSPAAMNELQKLCDKVPSFDSTVAMQVGGVGWGDCPRLQVVVMILPMWDLVWVSAVSCSNDSAAVCLLCASTPIRHRPTHS